MNTQIECREFDSYHIATLGYIHFYAKSRKSAKMAELTALCVSLSDKASLEHELSKTLFAFHLVGVHIFHHIDGTWIQ